MPLAPEHLHKLKAYKYRNQKQFTCTVIFCKLSTRNPLDLMGMLVQCANENCKRTYRFEAEDAKQEGSVVCPLCLGTNKDRIKETEVLNEVVMEKAINLLNDEAVASNKGVVDEHQVEAIVTADLIKEMREIRSVFDLEEEPKKPILGSAKVKEKDND